MDTFTITVYAPTVVAALVAVAALFVGAAVVAIRRLASGDGWEIDIRE